VAVGTDYYANDFLTELKTIAVLGKLWQTGFDSTKATDVFYGATVGGAKAMGRHDIGRLLVGYRGDLLIVNDKNPFLRPMTFPVINLLHYGNSSDIDTVIVDGKVLKQGGDLVGMKKEDISDKAEKAVLKCWAHARKLGVI
jgi:5-methylthioadenosine/S-adenosylhomocysteine deaminase